MIYLIKTSVFIEGENDKEDKAVMALKIGYSKDERGEGRFSDYINAGLSFKVLKSIPGGSLRLETYLHNHFKDYSIESRSREWYYYDKKIVEFFLRCEDISGLYNLFGVNSDEELLQRELDNRSYRYRLNLELLDGVERFRRERPEELNKNIYKLLVDIQSAPCFTDKMRLLCSNNLGRENLNILLLYLPEDIKNYYNVLGPEKIKALYYRNDNIVEEYKKRINNQDINLRDEILKLFLVGERYRFLIIKKQLCELYKKLGYEKTPKATDINQFFDTKQVNISINGKREGGYLILGIKS